MSSTVQLRRLSQELVRLRKAAKLTVEEVTVAMEWSRGRLTYMEKAKWVKADIGNVTRLLDLYGATPAEREELLGLARGSKEKGWWLAYKDVFRSSLPGFEDAATMIRTYESVLIPGLLQTEDYARAVMLGGQVLDREVIDRKIEARTARQELLSRESPPQLLAIVDEAALQRLVGGPAVMAAQIRRLIELAVWPHITIHVLPNSAGAHAGLTGGRFTILDFPGDDKPLVYLEEASSELLLETADAVQSYTVIFSRITSSALGPEESVAYLATLRDRLN
jgi:transcriptional regulator with XRE-family HTH domain